MDKAMLIELFGYLGSALVVVSMLMSSVVKLRIINTVGSVIFAIYALIIRSYPTAAMNFCLVAINLYNLAKLMKTDKAFEMVDSAATDSFVDYFLACYKDDIKNFFPAFKLDAAAQDVAIIICCNAKAAGILLGRRTGQGEVNIDLEYTTPEYRDCSVGRYLYGQLRERGVKRLVFDEVSNDHEWYLEKMGYRKEGNTFLREL